MRVSESFSQSTFFRNMKQTQSDLSEALSRMSSGERVHFASDDPEAASELATLADEAQKLTMRRNGLSQSRPWLQMTEQAVTELGNTLISAVTYAEQGASSTLQPAERTALAEQIKGLHDQVNGLTNLRIGGRYIFSGTKTDVPPYAADGSYQGNDNTIEIPLDQGTTTINMPADQVFGSATGGAIKLLTDLESALRTGTAQDVQAQLDGLRAAVQANSATLSKVGNASGALEDADLRLADRQLSVQTRAHDLGAANLAEAISDAAKFQQGHQATLAAGSRLFGPTFFDFLG